MLNKISSYGVTTVSFLEIVDDTHAQLAMAASGRSPLGERYAVRLSLVSKGKLEI